MHISVVIPARNRQSTLADCLESVLAQTRPPAEVLVVDDRSTDRTAEVAAHYAARGVRCLENHGPPGAQAARNVGVRAARHPWIAFQDSDDIWLPDKLALQAAALEQRKIPERVLVHGGGLRRDDSLGVVEPIPMHRFEGRCHRELLLHPGPMFPAFLVHRDRLQDIGFLDEQCPAYQEWDTAIRLAEYCDFVQIDESLFEWRWHGGEAISKDAARGLLGFAYVARKHRRAIEASHSQMAWRKLMLDNLRSGLTAGCYPQVQELASAEARYPEFRLAAWLARGRAPGWWANSMLRYMQKTLTALEGSDDRTHKP